MKLIFLMFIYTKGTRRGRNYLCEVIFRSGSPRLRFLQTNNKSQKRELGVILFEWSYLAVK